MGENNEGRAMGQAGQAGVRGGGRRTGGEGAPQIEPLLRGQVQGAEGVVVHEEDGQGSVEVIVEAEVKDGWSGCVACAAKRSRP